MSRMSEIDADARQAEYWQLRYPTEQEPIMDQQQQNEREHQAWELVKKLKAHCSPDEFALLCWMAGFSAHDFD